MGENEKGDDHMTTALTSPPPPPPTSVWNIPPPLPPVALGSDWPALPKPHSTTLSPPPPPACNQGNAGHHKHHGSANSNGSHKHPSVRRHYKSGKHNPPARPPMQFGPLPPQPMFPPPYMGAPVYRPGYPTYPNNGARQEQGNHMNPEWHNQRPVYPVNNIPMQQSSGPNRPPFFGPSGPNRPPYFGQGHSSNFGGPILMGYYPPPAAAIRIPYPPPPGAIRLPYIPYFMPPAQPLEMTTQTLRDSIVKQIEYYFCDENLKDDHYLISLMDDHGWVPISSIANFRRVKNISGDVNFIIKCLQTSNSLEVKGENVRSQNWRMWIAQSIHDEDDQMIVNEHDVQRLVIVTHIHHGILMGGRFSLAASSCNCKFPAGEVFLTVSLNLLCAVSSVPVLHRVGGKKGTWEPDVNFTEWANHEKFYTGDWLYFGFNKSAYNVLEVNRTSYLKCNGKNFITNITKGGRDVFNLTEAKKYYFICNTNKGRYCFRGMKLAVQVEASLPMPTINKPCCVNYNDASTNARVTIFVLLLSLFVWTCLCSPSFTVCLDLPLDS
ncbi:hypothetical protein ACFE04_014759 [Oxalis oulophora]